MPDEPDGSKRGRTSLQCDGVVDGERAEFRLYLPLTCSERQGPWGVDIDDEGRDLLRTCAVVGTVSSAGGGEDELGQPPGRG